MAVYVDELRRYNYGPRCFRDGASHMTADTLEELHAMAAKIGLKRAWFQNESRFPHYDLTTSKRELALGNGAVFQTARERYDRKKAALLQENS